MTLPLPDQLQFIPTNVNRFVTLARNGGLTKILVFLLTDIINLKIYDRYSRLSSYLLGTAFVVISVHTFELIVNLKDRGIGKHLVLFGTWEEKPAKIFESELNRLSRQTQGGIIVDIGANIGYYSLIAVNALTDDGEVLAIEPAQENTSLLERNIRLNDCTDRVTVISGAIGNRTGEATLQLASESNLHRIEHDRVGTRDGGEQQTTLWSLDDLLDEYDYSHNGVIGLRMDVEGYEIEVLEGMKEVLQGDNPMVMYVEVHNNIFDRQEAQIIPQLLEEAGFEICAVERGIVADSPFDITFQADSWGDLPRINRAYSLIARR